jgi:hypothetical protein
MTSHKILIAIVILTGLWASQALAECNISDSKIEEAILQKPEFRDPANRQMVRDIRSLRDSAFILWSYGRIKNCERLMANIRELVASPSMGSLGGNDEDEADLQEAAREPLVRRGGEIRGHRKDKGAGSLIRIDEIAPGLRADEIIGAEVRTSDDKIVGEVRNIVLGTKDRRLRDSGFGRIFRTWKRQYCCPYPVSASVQRTRDFLPPDHGRGGEESPLDARPGVRLAFR